MRSYFSPLASDMLLYNFGFCLILCFVVLQSASNRIKLAVGLFTAILSTILSALSKKAKQSC